MDFDAIEGSAQLEFAYDVDGRAMWKMFIVVVKTQLCSILMD